MADFNSTRRPPAKRRPAGSHAPEPRDRDHDHDQPAQRRPHHEKESGGWKSSRPRAPAARAPVAPAPARRPPPRPARAEPPDFYDDEPPRRRELANGPSTHERDANLAEENRAHGVQRERHPVSPPPVRRPPARPARAEPPRFYDDEPPRRDHDPSSPSPARRPPPRAARAEPPRFYDEDEALRDRMPPPAHRPAARPARLPAHFEDDEPARRDHPPARRERAPAPPPRRERMAPPPARGSHREMPASRHEAPPFRRDPREYDEAPPRRSRPERSEPARHSPPPRDDHRREPAPRAATPPARPPVPSRAHVPAAARPAPRSEPASSSWLVTPPLPASAREALPHASPFPAASNVKILPSATQAEAHANLRAAWAPLMQVLGYDFRDITLLERGLTHSSSKGQAGGRYHDNETMEFLGDSVLGLVIAEWLYEKLPEADEGVMSKLKSHLVSTKNMAEIAMQIRIPDFMILGGSGVVEARKNERLVCSTLEAVTGAIFLDGGYEPSKRMLRKVFYEQMRNLNPQETMEEDAKSTIQEYLQTKHHMLPHYESFLHKDAGDKIYITVIKVRGQVLGEGMGKAKKDSQQDAARRSLERLRSGLVKIK